MSNERTDRPERVRAIAASWARQFPRSGIASRLYDLAEDMESVEAQLERDARKAARGGPEARA